MQAHAGDVVFDFPPHVPVTDAEQTLHLAMLAVEGLFGRARVRLDARYEIDIASGAITLDASNEVGAAVARVFTCLLIRERGETSF